MLPYLHLSKVYLKIDQPKQAIDTYTRGLEKHPQAIELMIGIARVYEGLNDLEKSAKAYKQVLALDSSNVEGMASLASNYFYTDQPEVALRYYRRLLQVLMFPISFLILNFIQQWYIFSYIFFSFKFLIHHFFQ